MIIVARKGIFLDGKYVHVMSALGVIRNQCVIDLTKQCLILIYQFRYDYDCPVAEQML